MNTDLLEKQTLSRRIVLNGVYRTRKDARSIGLGHIDNNFVTEVQRIGVPDVVFGDFILHIDGEGESEFDSQRHKLGLQLMKSENGVTCANLAYARFMVVKGYKALPPKLAVRRVNLLDYVSVYNLCEPTEEALLTEALKLDAETTLGEYSIDGVSTLLIVDKVYVAEIARRCGISEYIHKNLADIAHVYLGVRPKLVILNCGDFSNAHLDMQITETEYKNLLKKHYEGVGYHSVDRTMPYVMWKQLS